MKRGNENGLDAVGWSLLEALQGNARMSFAEGLLARSEARLAANDPMFVAGTSAAFRYLAAQSSNRCELEPRSLLQMANKGRLQGSCCSPMDLAAYQSQVRGLRAYRDIVQIPRDPYDIPVSLAKRLLSYDRTITLSAAQSRTLRRAVKMSREHRFCCCGCWRWYGNRGLSKYLIAHKGWRASRVARVIGLFQGCGGAV